MNDWFIKLFRSLIDWEWYDDINTCRLFIHLLLKVNYMDIKWRWIDIKKGERLTSYWNLSSEIGISVMQVRTCLKKLKSTGEVTIKTTNNYTLIKLNNYEKYNWDNTQDNKPLTNKEQTDNNQITTNKESKNIKKDNNIINNNISKDITTEVVNETSIIKEESFWNDDINKMQEFIKLQVEKLWYLYKSWKQERNRIRNILTWKEINWTAEKCNMNIWDFVSNIFLMSTKLDFWNWKITNAETFYKHYAKIMNEAISLKQAVSSSTWVVEIDI